MNKAKTDEAIRLTQELLERYWQHDYQYAISNMAEDVVWVGAAQEEFMRGIDLVHADLKKVDRELKSCHLKAQEYIVVHNCGKSCSVAGKYLVTTDPDTGIFLQVQQRCMAVWELVENRFVMKGLHVSNPMGELKLVGNESFPNHLGRQAYQYLTENIMKEKNEQKFALTDINSVTHFIYEGELESVEAERHRINIYLLDGVIHANVSISAFLEQHKNIFVRVHRSFAVNPRHISHIIGNEIIMDSGRTVTISIKNKTKICSQIEKML